jgi:hypothetical protein
LPLESVRQYAAAAGDGPTPGDALSLAEDDGLDEALWVAEADGVGLAWGCTWTACFAASASACEAKQSSFVPSAAYRQTSDGVLVTSRPARAFCAASASGEHP